MRTGGSTPLAIAAVSLGITSVYLFWQLEAERTEARAALQQQVEACSSTSNVVQIEAPPAHALIASDLPAPAGPAPHVAVSVNAATSVAPSGAARFPVISTEYSEYLARKRYAPMFRELGLSAQEIDALLPLLAAQSRRANEPIPASRLGPDGRELQDSASAERSAHDQAEVAAIIGPERAAKLTEVQKQLPVRMQVRMLRSRLEDTDEPLTDEQQKLLISALNGSAQLFPRRVEGESQEQSMNRMRSWQADADKRARRRRHRV